MATQPWDVEKIRKDFPILGQTVNGRPLVYLDNAATTQKPLPVLEALDRFYREQNGNVHRGVHSLGAQATRAFEGARGKVQRLLGAADAREIVFVRGTTEGINLVAQTYGRQHVGAGDEVVVTTLEHHSNIVPWQLLCQEKGARLRAAPISDRGELLLDELERLLGPRTKMVAVGHVSNALGTVNPVREIVAMAHRQGVPVLVDGAQAVPHLAVDVRDLDCDFYVFSGHKVYGPGGIGALYGKRALLEAMPPYQGGGEMIHSVSFEETTFAPPPHRFEAGTPNVAGAVGLGAALDYLAGLDREAVRAHEQSLWERAVERVGAVPGVRLVGTAPDHAPILSFELAGVHPHDLATILDQQGIAIRAGNHCAEPLMKRLGVTGTARASFALYNTHEEVDLLAAAVEEVGRFFA